MKITREQRLPAAALPPYLGTTVGDTEIVGIGSDIILTIDDALQMITYSQALKGTTVAEVERPSRIDLLRYYSDVLHKLSALGHAPEQDELGRVRPSETAIKRAADVAFRVFRTGSGIVATADVSVDRDGDIRVLWENGERTLELVCPFDDAHRQYIYYSDAARYDVAYDLSMYRLGQLFGWLAGRSDRFPR